MKVLFNSIEEAAEFVEICERYNFDIDAKVDRFIVDAKSFLGLVALGIEKTFAIEIHTDEENIKKSFYDKIEKFKNK